MRRRKKNVEENIVEEVVIEPVEELPEDAEIVDEVIIEPADDIIDEEIIEEPVIEEQEEVIIEPVEETIRIGDRVQLIEMIDYSGKELPFEPETVFVAYSIHGDKVNLKNKGLISGSTKLDNIKKI